MPTYLRGLRIYEHVNKNWFVKEQHQLTDTIIQQFRQMSTTS
jgi:hypothetical protein